MLIGTKNEHVGVVLNLQICDPTKFYMTKDMYFCLANFLLSNSSSSLILRFVSFSVRSADPFCFLIYIFFPL